MRRILTTEAFQKLGFLRVMAWLARQEGKEAEAEKFEIERKAVYENPDSYQS